MGKEKESTNGEGKHSRPTQSHFTHYTCAALSVYVLTTSSECHGLCMFQTVGLFRCLYYFHLLHNHISLRMLPTDASSDL